MVERLRFLVVDDNREFAQDLCELLALEGSHATVAVDAEEALEHLEHESFHGLFTDQRLPGQSGVELMEELNRRGLALPVVLITAYADDNVVQRALSAGAVEIMSKPLDIERWIELTRRLSNSARSTPVNDTESPRSVDFEMRVRS
jgi:DNA-binding NtrC family response regulator